MTTWGMRFAVAATAVLVGCNEESVDWTGEWQGGASLIVDGESKEVPLRLGLSQNGAQIGGTIHWGDHVREVTSATALGPEVDIESVTTTDRFRLKGLFRNGSIQGRFWIQYPGDPEPYPGSFTVKRER